MIASDRMRRTAAMHVLALEDPDASEEAVLAAIDWVEEKENYQLARKVARFSLLCETLATEFPGKFSSSSLRRAWVGNPLHWAIAAMLGVLAVGLGATMFYLALPKTQSSGQRLAYYTAVGENRTITLPDRSQVALGAASEILVSYDANDRQIKLTSGEAFFEIAKDLRRPFTVTTLDGRVRAVGTAFNVHRGSTTTVTLLRGVVEVVPGRSIGGPAVTIHPNTQVELDRVRGVTKVRRVDARAAISWQQGIYRYEDVPLAKIVDDLRRYYPRQIVIDSNRTGAIRLTGVVRLTEPEIEQWLIGLHHLEDIAVSISPEATVIGDRDLR